MQKCCGRATLGRGRARVCVYRAIRRSYLFALRSEFSYFLFLLSAGAFRRFCVLFLLLTVYSSVFCFRFV